VPFSKLDRGNIFYETSGKLNHKINLPIVILKPLSRGPIGIQPFIDVLAYTFFVINYDQRGLGKSEPSLTPGPVPMSERANEVVELLDGLSIKSVHLLCHSTGCGIGLSMVKKFPERVESLTLVSPWTHADHYLNTMQNLRVSAAKGLNSIDYFRFNISLLYPPSYRKQHERGFRKMELEAKSNKVDYKVVSDGLTPILEFNSKDILPTIKCPTLISYSRDDQLMPFWFGQYMAKNIKGAVEYVFDEGGHMLLETCRNRLGLEITNFIKIQSNLRKRK
jgi:pimeloyl-ACP methyl ester carboxylesterase